MVCQHQLDVRQPRLIVGLDLLQERGHREFEGRVVDPVAGCLEGWQRAAVGVTARGQEVWKDGP